MNFNRIIFSIGFYMLIDVLLTNDKVRMRDSSAVEQKLNQIINADKDKLLVRLVIWYRLKQ